MAFLRKKMAILTGSRQLFEFFLREKIIFVPQGNFMNEKNPFIDQIKEKVQKARTVIKDTVQEVVDESGLSTKEGREKILKKAKDVADKAKESVIHTAQRGTSATKKAANQTIKIAQVKSEKIKTTIKDKVDNLKVDKVTGKKSVKGAVIVAVDDADTHCAYYTLEQEYYMMEACIESCGPDHVGKCAVKIKEFECLEKKDYFEAQNDLDYSCPIGNSYRY